MKNYNQFINELQGYADVYTKGLHNAKEGSFIRIGLQGNPNKFWGKIDKIDKNGRFVTTDGDVFDKNGQLHRAKRWEFQQQLKKKLKASAMLVTKSALTEETMSWVKKSLYEDGLKPCKDPKIILEIAKLLKRAYPQLEEIVNDK